MPNTKRDDLFQLIKSLNKTDKRLFKLYIKRISGNDDLKSITLFDALDNMNEYDEDRLLSKNPTILKQQLSNMKAALYRQILASINFSNLSDISLQLNEQMSFARILYNKGLYQQALKVLEKLKAVAKENMQDVFWLQATMFEKKIESLHITRSLEGRAEELAKESHVITKHVLLEDKLSNLSLQLYGWYIRQGHVSDMDDADAITTFFDKNLPECLPRNMRFYEKLYYYQSYCWYNFILQSLPNYYRYSQKWVSLFDEHDDMKAIETSQYIKGIHNLLSAHFVLLNYKKFAEDLEMFERFATSELASRDINIQIQVFIYLHIARINFYFMHGRFAEGIQLVPHIEEKLNEYKLQIDTHRVLVFYYKIACIYFASGDMEMSVEYLNRIINSKTSLRNDLQCYARLLHLMAHYEMENYTLVEYLIRSVYRFMAKMKTLSVVEEEIFGFLRKSFSLNKSGILAALKVLREKLGVLQTEPLANRSFMYLDIISWMDSKIKNVPLQKIIEERYHASRSSFAEESNSMK